MSPHRFLLPPCRVLPYTALLYQKSTCQHTKTLASLAGDTRLLGYQYEDYSGDSYRFKDDPLEGNFDGDTLLIRVLGGLVIVGTVVIASGAVTVGVAALGIKAASAGTVMTATAITGSMAVGVLALNDIINRQVSDMSEYVKAALNGSIIGALTGAVSCIPTKSLGFIGRNVMEFAIGAGESAVEQQLWEGEVDFKEAVACGILNVILGDVVDTLGIQGKAVSEGGTSALNDWINKIPELSKQAPIEIPSSATVKAQAKNGYDQISFKWIKNGQNYEVRWHTKTPGAPEGQGNTWVVSRVTPGTPTGQVRTEHILVGDTWIPRYQWQDAINAYKSRTATQEQLQLLKDGHWQAP